MKKKAPLAIVKMNEAESKTRIEDENRRRKQAEQPQPQAEWRRRENEASQWMIGPDEIAVRVRELRARLELLDTQLAALPFDIIEPEPWSVDARYGKQIEVNDIVERLNPTIGGYCKRLQKYLEDAGHSVDDDLFPMRWAIADTAYAIGVLAGAIFSGQSERQINRLERGLAFAIASRPDCRK